MAKRKMPALNTSSTADIAFLLLIFFLLTTTMATDTGLSRRLPPPVDEELEQKVEDRNVLVVLVNSANEISVDGELVQVKEIKDLAKEFILNPENKPDMPKKTAVTIKYVGEIEITKQHVISLQNDRGTRYAVYLDVQNELVAAYNELREDLSKKTFGKSFKELDTDQQEAIVECYPQKISEAEPKQYGLTSGGTN